MDKHVYGIHTAVLDCFWGPFIWTFFLLSMYTRLEYPSYRDDKGGSTESREGDTESQTGYMHTR